MKAALVSSPVAVIKRSSLVENAGVCALIDGVQVAIFYLPQEDQQIFALGNWDPAGQANVLSRGIVGDIQGELVVASPLYKHHYSLLTGQCLEDAHLQVPVYQARIEGEAAVISVQECP